PLFSSEHRLLFPVGSIVRGQVTGVNRARSRHHHGQLAFAFTTIEPPAAWTSSMQASVIETDLFSVQVGHDMKDLRIDEQGNARIVESKKRFIGPGWAFISAGRSLNATADPFGTALLGAYRNKFLKQFAGREPGFGFPASISSAMIPHVAVGLGFYGAARAV